MKKEENKPGEMLKEYDIKKVQKAIRDEQMKQHEISEKDQKIYDEMLKVADMPVVLTNAGFKLGKQELDIRKLSDANFRQMFFREQVLTNIYSKATVDTLMDILRLLMVIATKLGVEDIVGATDELIEKLNKQQAEKLSKLN